ncbi:MAG TPA: histidine kinase [Chitinophagaceae bacterium]|nr:histidine kinase [Chitinophagaceae bacterium]
MAIKFTSKQITLWLHILVWSAILSLPYLLPAENHQYKVGAIPGPVFTIAGIIHAIIFYSNAFFLYPRLLNKRSWWLYVLCSAAIIIGSNQLKFFILSVWFPEALHNRAIYGFIFAPSVVVFIISIVYRRVLNNIRYEKEQKEKQAERLSSELKFLRSQVSPHFLFNVMTNMVSLARQKSDLLEPSLIKLSDLLRYMLYESDEEKFSIKKEIDCLKDYIELQQLRFGDDVNVQLDLKNENPDCSIEPMLLFPFVENAFKHSIGLVKDPFIKICLQVKEQHLFFSVVNKYSKENFSKDKNSGIGLSNVKNRLNLLYPGKYKLDLKDDGTIFKTELNLELSC